MDTGIDIIGSLGIAGLVWFVIEALGAIVPTKAKPPLAMLLGVGWALVGFVSIGDAYPNVLTAIAVGITAGAAASGIASTRSTYEK